MIIAIDGLDGVGKTTLISDLRDHLVKNGCSVALYAPIRTSPLARSLKSVTLAPEEVLDYYQRAILSLSLIIQTFKDIEKLSKENDYVILDRFLVSHMFYNGLEDGVKTYKSALYHSFLDKVIDQYLKKTPFNCYGVVMIGVEELLKKRLQQRGYENWLDTNHAPNITLVEKQTTMVSIQNLLVYKGWYNDSLIINVFDDEGKDVPTSKMIDSILEGVNNE